MDRLSALSRERETDMEIGKLIGYIINLALILGTLGLLREATIALKREAASTQRHTVSLGAFNRSLQRGR